MGSPTSSISQGLAFLYSCSVSSNLSTEHDCFKQLQASRQAWIAGWWSWLEHLQMRGSVQRLVLPGCCFRGSWVGTSTIGLSAAGYLQT
jgi:hypothetical protein